MALHAKSFFQQDMNRIFGRMSIFSEGGYVVPKGTLVSLGNRDLIKLNKTTQGNDLTSSKIMEFYSALKKRYSDFVILGFSHQAFDSELKKQTK